MRSQFERLKVEAKAAGCCCGKQACPILRSSRGLMKTSKITKVETGLPGKVVGTVDVREKHLFVDVNAENANVIVAKLNRTQIKGHKVKVKEA